MTARLDAVLHGQANPDGSACFWVPDGQSRVALIWPQGYFAKGTPLAVYDEKGELIGVVGKSVALGGGRAAPDATVSGCSDFIEAWIVEGPAK